MKIKSIFTYLVMMSFLTACKDINQTSDTESRDLSGALSFSDLIEGRMNNDTTLNNSIVLIHSELQASFSQPVACPVDILPCTEDNYDTDVVEPVYQGSSLICTGNGFMLHNDRHQERLIVNLDEHTEFFTLTEVDTRKVNFYARIEYVNRQAWCSAQTNYGLKITLLEGEEAHLLKQYD